MLYTSHSSAPSVASVRSSVRTLRNRLKLCGLTKACDSIGAKHIPREFALTARGNVNTSLAQALWFSFISLFCSSSFSETCVARRS